MKEILVIEDEQSLQLLIEFDFKELGYKIDFSGNGQDGLTLLKEHNYDLAIIDWMLPGLSGIEIIKEIRKTNIDLKIIMLTAKDSEMDIVHGLEAGADDYLTKPFSSRELKARVKSLLRRKEAQIIVLDNIEINKSKREVKLNNIKIDLSKAEYDLLMIFLDNVNIVFSRESLLDKLNKDEDIDARIIDSHISSLKKKLILKDRIITKRGVGYVFVE